MDTTGDRIKRARLAAGLTQEELATKIGVKYSAIHKYESGLVVNLKRTTIAELAKALDVKPSWLLCVDDDPAPGISPVKQELLDLVGDLTSEEITILEIYRDLSQQGKEYIKAQLDIARQLYQKNIPSAEDVVG